MAQRNFMNQISLNNGSVVGGQFTTILTSDLPSVTASKLLGRGSAAGAGDEQEIAIGAGLTLSGTTLSTTASGLPGGANTSVQYNDSNAFGGDAYFTWDKTNKLLTVYETGSGGVIIQSAGAGHTEVALKIINSSTGNVFQVDGTGAVSCQGDINCAGSVGGAGLSSSGNITAQGTSDARGGYYVNGTAPVADGTYTVGGPVTAGVGVNGTITTVGGIITAIQQAT